MMLLFASGRRASHAHRRCIFRLTKAEQWNIFQPIPLFSFCAKLAENKAAYAHAGVITTNAADYSSET